MKTTNATNLIGVKQIGSSLHIALSYRHVEAESFLLTYNGETLTITSTDTPEVQDALAIQGPRSMTLNQQYQNNILHITLSP